MSVSTRRVVPAEEVPSLVRDLKGVLYFVNQSEGYFVERSADGSLITVPLQDFYRRMEQYRFEMLDPPSPEDEKNKAKKEKEVERKRRKGLCQDPLEDCSTKPQKGAAFCGKHGRLSRNQKKKKDESKDEIRHTDFKKFVQEHILAISYGRVVFEPRAPGKEISLDRGVVNLWTGFRANRPRRNDRLAEPFWYLVRLILADDDEQKYRYLRCWLASLAQHPERKIGVCPIFAQGSGRRGAR